MNRRGRAAAALAIAGLAAPGSLPGAQGSYHFVDVAAESGLVDVTWHGRPDKPHLLESGGAGLALLDFDGDADLDLYVVAGWRLDDDRVIERGRDHLYRNRGDGTFEDVTEAAGLGHDGWGTAVTVGDIEGDGDPDLFVTNFGADLLYRNQGDGTFAVVDGGPGIDGWSSSSVFFDADGDGDEDLFVTGYVEATLDEVLSAKPALRYQGVEVMMGPFGLEGLANAFFVNDGRGDFTEATEAAGLTDVGLFFSFGVLATDFDGDADLDLYVANDSNPNYLYENQGGGTFREIGLWSGAALSKDGQAQAGMGIAAGDYDADGRTDMLVTHFANDTATLYRNLGRLAFEDVSAAVGLREATYAPLQWGTTFGDFDLDGDLEVFIANGHIYPQADAIEGQSYRQTNQLLAWRDGRFHDLSAEAGPGLQVRESSRGVAAGDIDNDGDVDLAVANVDAAPTLLRNESPRGDRHWLIVDAPRARRVRVRVPQGGWTREWTGGGSYASASDPRFHFGLGDAERIEAVEITWPDGRITTIEAPPIDRVLQVEG